MCSLCRKLGTNCEYAAQVSQDEPAPLSHIPEQLLPMYSAVDTTSHLEQGDSLNFMPFAGMNFNFYTSAQPTQAGPAMGYPSPDSGLPTLPTDDAIESQQDLLASFQLPDDDLLIELVKLFFEHLYHLFPCFHKKSFLANVKNGHFQKEAPLLLYAICCIASRHHPDTTVRKRQGDWYEQAKFSYDLTRRFPHQALRTIQAVLLLVYHAFTIGDFSSSWLFLGKAWRQVVALGMNRMDAAQVAPMTSQLTAPGPDHLTDMELSRPKTAVEKEEYRRTLWLLFIMDRNHAWYVDQHSENALLTTPSPVGQRAGPMQSTNFNSRLTYQLQTHYFRL